MHLLVMGLVADVIVQWTVAILIFCACSGMIGRHMDVAVLGVAEKGIMIGKHVPVNVAKQRENIYWSKAPGAGVGAGHYANLLKQALFVQNMELFLLISLRKNMKHFPQI